MTATIKSIQQWSQYDLPLDRFPTTPVVVQATSDNILLLHHPKPMNRACQLWVRGDAAPVLEALAPWVSGQKTSASHKDLTVEVCTGCQYDGEGQSELEGAFWAFDQALTLNRIVATLRESIGDCGEPDWVYGAGYALWNARYRLEFHVRRDGDPPPLRVVAFDSDMQYTLGTWFSDQLTVADGLIAAMTAELRRQLNWDGPRKLLVNDWVLIDGTTEDAELLAYLAAGDMRAPRATFGLGPYMSIPQSAPAPQRSTWLEVGPDRDPTSTRSLDAALFEVSTQQTLVPQTALAVGLATA